MKDLIEIDRLIEKIKALDEENEYFEIGTFIDIHYKNDGYGDVCDGKWYIDFYIDGDYVEGGSTLSVSSIPTILLDCLEAGMKYINNFLNEVLEQCNDEEERTETLNEIEKYYSRIERS